MKKSFCFQTKFIQNYSFQILNPKLRFCVLLHTYMVTIPDTHVQKRFVVGDFHTLTFEHLQEIKCHPNPSVSYHLCSWKKKKIHIMSMNGQLQQKEQQSDMEYCKNLQKEAYLICGSIISNFINVFVYYITQNWLQISSYRLIKYACNWKAGPQ